MYQQRLVAPAVIQFNLLDQEEGEKHREYIGKFFVIEIQYKHVP